MMRRTRAQLKMLARRSLQGNYATMIVSSIIISAVASAMVIPMYMMLVPALVVAGVNEIAGVISSIVVVVIWLLAVSAISILLMAGMQRMIYQMCITDKAEISDLFYPLKKSFWRYLGVAVMVGLYQFLVSIPGIVLLIIGRLFGNDGVVAVIYLGVQILNRVLQAVVGLRYSQAMTILVENPECRVMEALAESKYLMQGNKWRLFVLNLSFIGISLLGLLSCGLGFLWIAPYMTTTSVFFYLSIKEEKYGVASMETDENEPIPGLLE